MCNAVCGALNCLVDVSTRYPLGRPPAEDTRAHFWLIASTTVVLQHVDNLPREKAFFKGPPPLLLSSVNPDDLTFLLLGSDPKTSQVSMKSDHCIQLHVHARTLLIVHARRLEMPTQAVHSVSFSKSA